MASSAPASEAHYPLYGEPDLNPDEPYYWTKEGIALEQQQASTGAMSSAGEEQASSKKRPRTSDTPPTNGHGEASSNGHGQGTSSSYVPRQRVAEPEVVQHYDQGPVPIPPSIFGIPPRNEFTKTVGEFLLAYARGRENVEVGLGKGRRVELMNYR